MMKQGICKLCIQKKFLCNKSHILPKHIYKIIKEDEYCLSVNKDTVLNDNKQKDYSGITETSILCENCENNIFSRYETYANKLIYSSEFKNVDRKLVENQLIISGEGYDYKKLKLYFLSILWKASISTNKFFESVTLRDDIEEKIRKMLLNGNPGEEHEFPIICALPKLYQDNYFNSFDTLYIQSPFKRQINETDVYIFFITGQNLCFIINDSDQFMNISAIKKDSFIVHIKSEKQTLKQRKNFIGSINLLYDK